MEKSIRFYQNIRNNPNLLHLEMVKLSKSISDYAPEKSDWHSSRWSDMKSVHARKAFAIGIGLITLSQLSGMPGMSSYTAHIFQESGSNLSPNMSAIVVGVIQILGTLVAAIFVDRFGRKVRHFNILTTSKWYLETFSSQFLLVASAIGTAMGLTTFGIYMMLKLWSISVEMFNWIPLVSFSFSTFFVSCGVMTLPFVVIAEIMPDKLKEFGMSLSMVVLHTLSILTTKLMPLSMDTLGFHGTLFLFSVVCIFGSVITILFVPETKDKSYEEIMTLLQ